jgi:hypothetical protein
MNTATTAMRNLMASAQTLPGGGVHILRVGVSGVLLAVTVLVCAQVRTDLRRSRFWIAMMQGQLQQVKDDLARARSDRAALLMRRYLHPMAAELPAILRKIPPVPSPQQIIATADTWRIVRQQEPGATGPEEIVFPRTQAEEHIDAAHMDG